MIGNIGCMMDYSCICIQRFIRIEVCEANISREIVSNYWSEMRKRLEIFFNRILSHIQFINPILQDISLRVPSLLQYTKNPTLKRGMHWQLFSFQYRRTTRYFRLLLVFIVNPQQQKLKKKKKVINRPKNILNL